MPSLYSGVLLPQGTMLRFSQRRYTCNRKHTQDSGM